MALANWSFWHFGGSSSPPSARTSLAFAQSMWLQSLTDHDFDLLAARRDQLVGQLEALYRSVSREMEVQT